MERARVGQWVGGEGGIVWRLTGLDMPRHSQAQTWERFFESLKSLTHVSLMQPRARNLAPFLCYSWAVLTDRAPSLTPPSFSSNKQTHMHTSALPKCCNTTEYPEVPWVLACQVNNNTNQLCLFKMHCILTYYTAPRSQQTSLAITSSISYGNWTVFPFPHHSHTLLLFFYVLALVLFSL